MQCDVCHNDYERTFVVVHGGRSWTFDCFECAIHALAPACRHCGTQVIGHGVEVNGTIFCCASCARAEEERGVVADRAPE